MKHRITITDLMLYMYGETSYLETMAISKALKNDASLRREYEKLQEAYTQLPEIELEPTSFSINNILAYSQSQNPHLKAETF